jgi:hypothetical protein
MYSVFSSYTKNPLAARARASYAGATGGITAPYPTFISGLGSANDTIASLAEASYAGASTVTFSEHPRTSISMDPGYSRCGWITGYSSKWREARIGDEVRNLKICAAHFEIAIWHIKCSFQ